MKHTIAAAATASLLALTMSACSDDSDSPSGESTTSEETTSSETSAPTAKDRSDEVFDGIAETDVAGSTSGKINLGVGSSDPELGGEEVTFEVVGVTASDSATILHYQLVADKDIDFRIRGEFWEQQPALRVPGSDVRMQALTARLPDFDGEHRIDICACTSVYATLTEAQPQEVVYPPLPEGTDEVEVILQELDPVSVPVSR